MKQFFGRLARNQTIRSFANSLRDRRLDLLLQLLRDFSGTVRILDVGGLRVRGRRRA